MPTKSKPTAFVVLLRLFTAAGIFIGGGGIMFSSPSLFWWAATFLYFGLIALAIDIGQEFKLKRDKWKRYIGWALTLFLIVAFSGGIVCYPATLQVTPVSFEGRYASGEKVYGIVWDDTFSDLRVDIFNPTDRDYDHLDLFIDTNPLLIRDQKQITNIPNVSILPMAHEVHIPPSEKNGVPTNEKNLSNLAHNRLRILCDRLPKKTTIGIILAISDLSKELKNMSPSHGNGIYILESDSGFPFLAWVRARPQKIRIVGSYSALNRPFETDSVYLVSQQ